MEVVATNNLSGGFVENVNPRAKSVQGDIRAFRKSNARYNRERPGEMFFNAKEFQF